MEVLYILVFVVLYISLWFFSLIILPHSFSNKLLKLYLSKKILSPFAFDKFKCITLDIYKNGVNVAKIAVSFPRQPLQIPLHYGGDIGFLPPDPQPQVPDSY